MNPNTRTRLEARGWRVGDAADFLGMNAAESAYVELKLALGEALRARRGEQALSQEAVARRIGSSQSRVAKMEAGDGTVSIDLLLRALLALGATPREIAAAIRRVRPALTPASPSPRTRRGR